MRRTPIVVYHAGSEAIAEAVLQASGGRSIISCCEPEQLIAQLDQVEVLFTTAPPRMSFAGARRLRLIQLLGAGADELLRVEAIPPDVQVAGLGDQFAGEVSEYVMAMMLASCRRLPTIVAQQAQRRWQPFPAETLAGKVLGLLGFGAIGRRVARLARAFDMRVVALRRCLARHEDSEIEVVGPDSLHSLLRQADYVVVALPLTRETRGLIDQSALAQLRPQAVLINVGRGAIVDERALVEALETGKLSQAVLDVHSQEPLPAASDLWRVPNLILSPHVAGYGLRYIERAVTTLLTNVERLENGDPLLYAIDHRRGY